MEGTLSQDPLAARDAALRKQLERALSNDPAWNSRKRVHDNPIPDAAVKEFRAYLDFLNKRQKRVVTAANYIAVLGPMTRDLGKPLSLITPDEIFDFLGSKTPATRRNSIKALRSFFEEFLGDAGHFNAIKRKVGKTPIPTKVKDVSSLIDADRLSALKKSARTYRDRAFIMALHESAMRVSEFLNIRMSDIDWRERNKNPTAPVKVLVRTSKTAGGENRRARLSNSVPILLRYIEFEHPYRNEKDFLTSERLLWVNRDGSCMSKSGVSRILRRAKEASGVNIRIHPHLFRTSRLTEMRHKLGLEPEEIRVLAGHASVATTLNSYIAVDHDLIDRKITGAAERTREEKEKAVAEYLKSVSPKVCFSCDAELDPDSVICDKCGTPVDEKKALEVMTKNREAEEELLGKLIEERVLSEMKKFFPYNGNVQSH